MVKFYLISIVDNIVTYEYYPEDHTDKCCGIIILDTVSKIFSIEKTAEEDCGQKYAFHAIRKIREQFETGEIPQKGMTVWY